MTLKESRVDHSYRVVKIHGSGPFKRRIMDMGITKNAEIYIRKVAPLGDPVQISIRGLKIARDRQETIPG